MYRSLELEILGHQEAPVPNTFYRQDGDTGHLAMILPGLGYSCDMPLLYYPTELLLTLGADVLLVEYDYRRTWKNADITLEEKLAHLYSDVYTAARVALAQRDYAVFSVIGKSLGTDAMTHLLESDLSLRPQSCVYLTPLLINERSKSETIRTCPRKLLVVGTADRYHDSAVLAEVVEATQSELLLVEGGDHSLEFSGDAVRSVQALEAIIRRIQEFFS